MNFARDTDMIVYCDIPPITRWAVTIIHFVGWGQGNTEYFCNLVFSPILRGGGNVTLYEPISIAEITDIVLILLLFPIFCCHHRPSLPAPPVINIIVILDHFFPTAIADSELQQQL